jgi:hypothetical protein
MSQEHPQIPAFRAELLNAIRHQDGKLTWYQLRHVVARFPHLSLELMPVLRALEAEGEDRVDSQPAGAGPAVLQNSLRRRAACDVTRQCAGLGRRYSFCRLSAARCRPGR